MLYSMLQYLKRNSSDYLYLIKFHLLQTYKSTDFHWPHSGLLRLVANYDFEEKSPLKTIMGLNNLHTLNIKACLLYHSRKPTETSWIALPPLANLNEWYVKDWKMQGNKLIRIFISGLR